MTENRSLQDRLDPEYVKRVDEASGTTGLMSRRSELYGELDACPTCRWLDDAVYDFQNEKKELPDADRVRVDLADMEDNHRQRVHPEAWAVLQTRRAEPVNCLYTYQGQQCTLKAGHDEMCDFG